MYAKVFTSIFDGSMRGHADLLLVFINLLCHADRDGRVDRTCKTISDETGISVRRVTAATAALEAQDLESRNKKENGRRLRRIDPARSWGWVVVNYEYYRNLRNELDRREQNREAQQRHRQQKSARVSKSKRRSDQSAQVEAEAEADASAEADVSTGKKERTTGLPGQIDYEKAKTPEINDYGDIENPANDLILVAIGVTGEEGKQGWGHWLKVLNRARIKLGKARADRLFRACLKELYGEIKAGECKKAGAVLNLKLTKTF